LIATTDFAVRLGAGTIIPYLPVFLLEQADASVLLIGLIAAAYFVGVFTGAGLAALRPGRRSRHLGLPHDLHLRRGAHGDRGAGPRHLPARARARSRRAPRRTRQTPAAARVALQAGARHCRGGGIV
jgi:hypothetical protein